MKKRHLGSLATSALGLGCMGMSPGVYGHADRAESLATIHAALDAGVDLLDTGDFYAMGHNEMLVAEAIRGIGREKVVLSVKFGAQRGPGGEWLGFDGRPAAVKTALAYTLQRLGTDHVDIYRPARLDPDVPIEETVGAIGDLIKAGYVRHVGLSEVGSDTLRRAAAVHPICDLQIEYSLVSRDIERTVLPTCRDLGIGVTAYGVLSRGLISGHWRTEGGTAADFRDRNPRFQGAAAAANLRLVEALRAVAREKAVSVAQIAVAWVMAQGDDIVPVTGARRRDQLAETLKSLDVVLSPSDRAAIEEAVPKGSAVGDRYDAHQMAALDSERG